MVLFLLTFCIVLYVGIKNIMYNRYYIESHVEKRMSNKMHFPKLSLPNSKRKYVTIKKPLAGLWPRITFNKLYEKNNK